MISGSRVNSACAIIRRLKQGSLMQTIHQGLDAIKEVQSEYISADERPLEWRLFVALEAILREQLRQKNAISDLERLVRTMSYR